MPVLGPIQTLAWFAKRPSFWEHAVRVAGRRVLAAPEPRAALMIARDWAQATATPRADALRRLGFDSALEPFPEALRAEAKARVEAVSVTMGGPGDLDLLYSAVRATQATRVVETGVALGWSSLAILSALDERPEARLASVDMPYPRRNSEHVVGLAVPDRYLPRWTLIREPDRNGIHKALRALGGTIDLAHYDSDKSPSGRRFGYQKIWQALCPGGLFISDDIENNFAFKEFAEGLQLPFTVVENHGKFAGLIRKPVS